MSHRVVCRLTFSILTLVFCVFRAPTVIAEPDTVGIVNGNRLLTAIHRIDPRGARAFAAEIVDKISLLDRRRGRGANTANIPLHRREPETIRPPPADGKLDERTRRDLEENPILRDLYSRSPLASIRMLQRMREAAGSRK